MSATARILVIDDDPIVGRSCEGILAPDGHDVSVAFTGEEAMRRIESNDFDIVLLDLRIPGSGGLGLLRTIRKASPRTEVVVITGYPSIENAKESIRLGAFDYVTKPLPPQRLRGVIYQVLQCKPWAIQERC
ncbi:MAG: response regulator [Planctomycetes bacterium]|nr:response regulator [Planctomycetota bacterium]